MQELNVTAKETMASTVLFLALFLISAFVGTKGDEPLSVQRLVDVMCRDRSSYGTLGSYGSYGNLLPVYGYCNLYVQCGYTNVIKYCQAGEFFNGQKCVDSKLANCPYDPCYGKKNGETYGESQTCNGYYVCMDGVSNFRRCYNGYRYTAGGCVRDNTCRSSEVTPSVTSCDNYNYLASPLYPGVFFQRVPDGSYMQRPCPKGLIFDTSVCVCNYPANYHQTNEVSGGSDDVYPKSGPIYY